MSDHTHLPTPAFRDVLERGVVRAFRREDEIDRLRSGARTRRMRAAAMILVSLGVGASAGLASAQVRDAQRLDSLLGAATLDTNLVAMRLQLVRAQLDELQKRVNVGLLDKSVLVPTEIKVHAAEAELARSRFNIQETKATKMPPRDDLNAPLVNGRDYVMDRLQLDAYPLQDAYNAAREAQAEAERRVRVGVGTEFDRLDADSAFAVARSAIGVASIRIQLRKEFLEKGTPIDQLGHRLAQTRVQLEALLAQDLLKIAQQRVALLEKRHAVGADDDLALLKARVSLKERELELAQVGVRLKAYR